MVAGIEVEVGVEIVATAVEVVKVVVVVVVLVVVVSFLDCVYVFSVVDDFLEPSVCPLIDAW